MLQYVRVMPNILVKRIRNCPWNTIDHLLAFNSTSASNVVAPKEEDVEPEISNKNNAEDKLNKSVDFLSIFKTTYINNDFKFNDCLETLKKLQSIRNTTIDDIDVFYKLHAEDISQVSQFLKCCTSRELNNLMSRFNLKKMNNLLMEDNITEELVMQIFKSFSSEESFNILLQLVTAKNRPTGILTTLCGNITNSKIDMPIATGVLYSLSALNFYNDELLQYVFDYIIKNISSCNNSFFFLSIVKSLGILRIKNVILLESLSEWVIDHKIDIQSDQLRAFFVTLAIFNYHPKSFSTILEIIVKPMIKQRAFSTVAWLDIVWALSVLDKYELGYFKSILNEEFLKTISKKNINIPKSLKILNINGLAFSNKPIYKGPILLKNSPLFDIPVMSNKDKATLSTSIIKALKLLLPGDDNYLNTRVDTHMGFVIDAEICIDNSLTPHPIKLNLEKNYKRVAILSVSFHELTYGLSEVTGPILFYSRLLEKKGYKVLLIRYSEMFAKLSTLERAKYIINELKLLLKI